MHTETERLPIAPARMPRTSDAYCTLQIRWADCRGHWCSWQPLQDDYWNAMVPVMAFYQVRLLLNGQEVVRSPEFDERN